jgi:hypothetical protein
MDEKILAAIDQELKDHLPERITDGLREIAQSNAFPRWPAENVRDRRGSRLHSSLCRSAFTP